jgi:AcrR family transcriptional regulator
MSKNNSEHSWIEAGYELFTEEGLEGLQVERLARITGLNKSGYYHYFGDRETYLEKLMDYHFKNATAFANDLKQVKHFDPEYIELLIKYASPMMFTNQLIKNRNHKLLFETQQLINQMVNPMLTKIFADFIGHKDHLEFAGKYFNQVRYMFHAQITPENMNYPFLRDFIYEAREVIQNAVELAAKTK